MENLVDYDESYSENSQKSESSSLSEFSSNSDVVNSEPLLWLKQQMKANNSPQKILEMLNPQNSFKGLNNYESWDMILQILTQPCMFKRTKLQCINNLKDFLKLLKLSKHILVLTGAGVSVSSGIPDFRSKNGLYARLAQDFPNLPDPQAMFDINYFKYDPRPFFKFAKEIYPGNFKPSISHQFIKYLEKQHKLLRNYTQNIDTLENEAHIVKKIECHGSFATASCMKCKYQVDAHTIKADIYNQIVPLCPICHKPNDITLNTNLVATLPNCERAEINHSKLLVSPHNSSNNTDSCNKNYGDGGLMIKNGGEMIDKADDNLVLANNNYQEDGKKKFTHKELLESYKRDMNDDENHGDGYSSKRRGDKAPTAEFTSNNECGVEEPESPDSFSSDDSSNPYFFNFHDTACSKSSAVKTSTIGTSADNFNHKINTCENGSYYRHKPVMKPDIVFFGEGLGEKFHVAIEEDKESCDLLIVMGSSMKVRPVSLIPNAVSPTVPQILINKEPLPHLNFDVEFLGDCDTIITEIIKRLYHNSQFESNDEDITDVNPPSNNNNQNKEQTTVPHSSLIERSDSFKRSHSQISSSTSSLNDKNNTFKKGRFLTTPFDVFNSYPIDLFNNGNDTSPLPPLREELYDLEHVINLFRSSTSLSSPQSGISHSIQGHNPGLNNGGGDADAFSRPAETSPPFPHHLKLNCGGGIIGTEGIAFERILVWDEAARNYYVNYELNEKILSAVDDKTFPIKTKSPTHLVKLVKTRPKMPEFRHEIERLFKTEESPNDDGEDEYNKVVMILDDNLLGLSHRHQMLNLEDESKLLQNFYVTPIFVQNAKKSRAKLMTELSDNDGKNPPGDIYAIVSVPVVPPSNNCGEKDDDENKSEISFMHDIFDKDGVATGLPNNTFLFVPPNRYIFPEAEIKK